MKKKHSGRKGVLKKNILRENGPPRELACWPALGSLFGAVAPKSLAALLCLIWYLVQVVPLDHVLEDRYQVPGLACSPVRRLAPGAGLGLTRVSLGRCCSAPAANKSPQLVGRARLLQPRCQAPASSSYISLPGPTIRKSIPLFNLWAL